VKIIPPQRLPGGIKFSQLLKGEANDWHEKPRRRGGVQQGESLGEVV